MDGQGCRPDPSSHDGEPVTGDLLAVTQAEQRIKLHRHVKNKKRKPSDLTQ